MQLYLDANQAMPFNHHCFSAQRENTHLPRLVGYTNTEFVRKILCKVLTRIRNKLIEFAACPRQHSIQHIFVYVFNALLDLIESREEATFAHCLRGNNATWRTFNSLSPYLSALMWVVAHQQARVFCHHFIFFKFNWIEEIYVSPFHGRKIIPMQMH